MIASAAEALSARQLAKDKGPCVQSSRSAAVHGALPLSYADPKSTTGLEPATARSQNEVTAACAPGRETPYPRMVIAGT